MALSRDEVWASYQSKAKYYDFALRLYGLLGIRTTYRRLAIGKLNLKPGDRVVELGCGTGINFPFIMEKIGSTGRLTGIDFSSAMLEKAGRRIKRFAWKNVELIESDIATYDFQEQPDAVLSVGVFGYLPEYDRIIRKISDHLSPGGRFAIMDGKKPDRLPFWFKTILCASRPFGVTLDYVDRCPWKSVEEYLVDTSFDQIYGGAIYISAGTKPISESTRLASAR